METGSSGESCLEAAPMALPSLSARGIAALGKALRMAGLAAALIGILLLAWRVHVDTLYTSGSAFGYNLGLGGGFLMLALLFYPVRKRMPSLGFLGPLRHWFRFHLLAGVAGPLLVLFHSTFRVGSFNAAIALSSMLLVVASGLIGRFLYRKIHRGLFGSRSTAAELQQSVINQLETLQPVLGKIPAIDREIEHFCKLVSHQPASHLQRTLHFTSAGWARQRVRRRIRKALSGQHDGIDRDDIDALLENINNTLKAVQRSAQFAIYERLFSLWHVVHIPFLFLLVVTAIVHVVAVHAY